MHRMCSQAQLVLCDSLLVLVLEFPAFLKDMTNHRKMKKPVSE